MWFLIKGTFWFSMVLVALSYLGGNGTGEQTSQMNVAGAVSAASEAYRYVSSICVEKPDVCIRGAETFHALGERAREGAKVAYALIDAQLADADNKTASNKGNVAQAPAFDTASVADAEPAQTSDDIKTGTIIQPAALKSQPYVPLPQRRPAP